MAQWREYDGRPLCELADVRLICEAFFGHSDMVETDFGYTVVWLGDGFREKVDEITLALALPYRTEI